MAWTKVKCEACGRKDEVLGKAEMIHVNCPDRKVGSAAPSYRPYEEA